VIAGDKAKYVEFESTNTEESVKLMFSLDEKLKFEDENEEKGEYRTCYSSELLVTDKQRSISYVIAVQDIKDQKWTLIEYRLKWQVDENDNLEKWEEP